VTTESTQLDSGRWYNGITSYQWLVLLIASLGWIFDVFEGQIFVASMKEAMPSLLPEGTSAGTISYYNNIAFAAFLLGGALGGVVFGRLSDRIGRTKTMIITILVYSCFTCVTAFAQTWWQMAIMRFFVAMGVGGEWAVASAMVAEVFPNRARAAVGSIFHGSSVFGTYLAIATGILIVNNPNFGWRWAFAVGALPAFLTLWIRWKLREPDKWVAARAAADSGQTQQTGRIADLFKGRYLRHTIVGVSLATIGMATFWGVHIYGRNLMMRDAENGFLKTAQIPADASQDEKDAVLKTHKKEIKNAEMTGMLLTTTGGGIGLFLFGPICTWIGRRGAFLVYHLGGLICGLLLFQVFYDARADVLWIALPVFGFWTLGMHAGYAVYFPELYPTRMRGTGGGFCFNVGRIFAAPILFLSGWMQKDWGFSLESSASLLSLLFLLAVVVLFFAPETKGKELPG